ncbi:MAG: cupin domain-containing protein [Proteobacteria bacterium]|nr:cupin domain-containing protein [Pseudomonadota bacterium]
MKTSLKGGCFILDPGAHKPGQLRCVIGRESGAKYLSQHILDLKNSPSPVYAFGNSDVILFAAADSASVTVSGQVFQMAPATGLYVRPGEAFQITPSPQSSPTRGEEAKNIPSPLMKEEAGEGAKSNTLSHDGKGKGESDPLIRILITVCPEGDGAKVLEEMPDNFDGGFPERVVEVDSSKKEAMGDRFFQVLVSKGVGSAQVTQFIGEIPLSKAPSHFHLYEEALYVLSGEGLMWTEDQQGAVKAGSIVFLPKQQQHSLECTSKSGLRVAGHFTPAGSPAENY